MLAELALLIAWLALGVSVLISIFWFCWLTKVYRLLSIYLWVIALANLMSVYVKDTGSNLSVLPLLSLATLLLFTKLFLDELFQEVSFLLRGLIGGALIVICFDIYYSYHGLSVRQFYALGTVASDLCIVIFCLLYFWKSLRLEEKLNQELWILNSVFLSYFSINTLLFFSINFLINEPLKVVAPFWMLNAFSASFLYSFLSYRIWKNGKIRRSSSMI